MKTKPDQMSLAEYHKLAKKAKRTKKPELSPIRVTGNPDQLLLMPTLMHCRYAVGIDPDLTENGVAIWDMAIRKIIDSRTMPFFSALNHITSYDKNDIIIYVESGWENEKVNFHDVKLPERMHNASNEAKAKYIAGVRERIAHDVGQNAAAGKLMVEMLTDKGYAVVLLKPTESKWTPAECEMATGIKTKNQERIDSIRLVVGR